MALEINYFPEIDQNHKYFKNDFLKKNLDIFKNIISDNRFGFFQLTERSDLLKSCQQIYEQKKEFKTFVQVGIGGSSLGPEMLISALKKDDCERQFIFINNIDPDAIYLQLKDLNPVETLFYFVSKSGGTAETMSGLSIIMHYLKDLGFDNRFLREHFVFATDPQKSQLLELGHKYEISCLEIPSNIGGRFSVLTPVGLLPALFAGIDGAKLLKGAEIYKSHLLDEDLLRNTLLIATSNILKLKDEGINQTVLMPYSSRLRDLSFWFVQLWAESLGKKKNIHGENIFQGLTPIPSYGATDQHSQMQLFMEGPRDKCLFMLEVSNFDHDYSLENDEEISALKKLAPFTLAQLMKAEFFGTLKALSLEERPYIHLAINKRDEHNLGAIIILLESLTALVGHCLEIDPFDQPGVEAGKKYAFEWLDKGE